MPDINGRLTDEEFYKACQDYARKKGLWDHADDFASEAFLMRKSWPKSNMRQFWANYWRNIGGVKGSLKDKFIRAVRYRIAVKKPMSDAGSVDYLENYVAAPEVEKVDIRRLPKREQMITILQYAGFTVTEISECFGTLSKEQIIKSKDKIRRAHVVKVKEGYRVMQKRRLRERISTAQKFLVDVGSLSYISSVSSEGPVSSRIIEDPPQ